MLVRKPLIETINGLLVDLSAALVVAPAGSGKSILGRQIAACERSDPLWLTVTQSGSFRTDMDRALSEAGTRLVVIDCCERLVDDLVARSLLERRLQDQSRRVLLLSRLDLGPSFVRLMADGVLGRVDGSELRFRLEEVDTVLERRKSGVDPGELCKATGGWVVAVTLSGSHPDEVSPSLRAFLDHVIMADLPFEDRSLVSADIGSDLGSDRMAKWHAKVSQVFPLDDTGEGGFRHVPVVRSYLGEYRRLYFPGQGPIQSCRVNGLTGPEGRPPGISWQPFGARTTVTVGGYTKEVKRTKVMELAVALTLEPLGASPEEIQGRLFPDLDRRRAGNYMRQIIFQLNQVTRIRLEREPRGRLRWPDACEVDSVDLRLEALMAVNGDEDESRASRLEAVLDQIAGSYLERSNLEWIEMRRYRLEALYRAALSEASRLALERGDFEAARLHSRALLDSDPHCVAGYTTLDEIERRIGTAASREAVRREASFVMRSVG